MHTLLRLYFASLCLSWGSVRLFVAVYKSGPVCLRTSLHPLSIHSPTHLPSPLSNPRPPTPRHQVSSVVYLRLMEAANDGADAISLHCTAKYHSGGKGQGKGNKVHPGMPADHHTVTPVEMVWKKTRKSFKSKSAMAQAPVQRSGLDSFGRRVMRGVNFLGGHLLFNELMEDSELLYGFISSMRDISSFLQDENER